MRRCGEGRGDAACGGADTPSWRSAELAEDDDGGDDRGDEGGGGAVAPEWDAPIPSTTAEMGDRGGGDREGEVGPGQPGQGCEEWGQNESGIEVRSAPATWPPPGTWCGRGQPTVTARTAGMPTSPHDQHSERAEPFDELADRGPRHGLGGAWAWSSSRGDATDVGGGFGHGDLEAPDADDAEELGRLSVADLGVDGVASTQAVPGWPEAAM